MAGCLDILGRLPDGGGPVDDPLAAARAIRARTPVPPDGATFDAIPHPYALARFEAIQDGLGALRDALAVEGLTFGGSASRNVSVASASGTPRPTCWWPPSMARYEALHGRVLVAGFRGVSDFPAAWFTANLRARGIDARAATADVPALARRPAQTNVAAAAAIEAEGGVDVLAKALRPLASGVDCIVTPAILGLGGHDRIRAALCEQIGAPVYEAPTLPPSVPGLRIYEALRRALDRLGARVHIGPKVIQGRFAGRRLVDVVTAAAARPMRRAAGAFVVATGGILGGGIVAGADGSMRDDALELPVTAPPHRAAWTRAEALNPRGHPAFRSGYRVESAMRILGADGEPIAENVTAAGSVVAGADVWRELSHEGVAVATAWRAAETAARRS
jgi:glycerol-3-phosphate dehydrogenase subunit B